MTNAIPNKKAICDVLLEEAENDKDIIVLCSDSKGSGSMSAFSEKYPNQFVEIGIAEQNLVSISAGLAKAGKKPFAVSPACFLSTRSYEQIKIDCAYSNTNVKLIGISGGISYGSLGMSHHSLQDIAAVTALPNMRVYIPSDRFETKKLIKELIKDNKPAYIRVGRNAVEDIYSEEDCPFALDKANVLKNGADVAIVACGEMVKKSLDAAEILKKEGIDATVIDMYCLKPFDAQTIIDVSEKVKTIFTVEEHSPYGGLGALVAQTVSANNPIKVINLSLPDDHVISGKSEEVFTYYGLDAKGIARKVKNSLK